MDSIFFRPMKYHEVDSVQLIEKSTCIQPWSKQNFEDSLSADDECWLCIVDNRIIGHIVFKIVLDEAQILTICLMPDWQGKGVGKILLDFALQKMKNFKIRKAFLEVRVSNKTALGLYNAFGFVEVGSRKNYYPKGDGREDAAVMQLLL